MMALSLSNAFKVSQANRKKALMTGLVLFLPVLLLLVIRLLVSETPKSDVMEVARAVLEEHVRRHPPNRTWHMTATRVTDKDKLEMDVNVANYHQAQVIQSRSGRVRYSYMKLACPALDAPVYAQLPEGETLWIRLHYNGQLIVRGACPLTKSLF